MDYTTHTTLSDDELTGNNLAGAIVYDASDEEVGTIEHVHGSGINSRVVLEVGGFLGLGTKLVTVQMNDLNVMRDDKGNVYATTALTDDELAELPTHEDV